MFFIFNLVRYFYIFFFEVLNLTEELFDDVGPALSKKVIKLILIVIIIVVVIIY